jgi:hypothetical protein
MKNVIFKTKIWAVVLLLLSACNSNQKDTKVSSPENESLKMVDLAVEMDQKQNPLEQEPPVIENLFIQKLKEKDANGNNVKLIATFPKGEIERNKFDALKINLDKETSAIFGDSGQNGDEKSNDNKFTALMNINEDQLFELAKQSNEDMVKNKSIETIFIGRSAIKRKRTPFDFNAFNRGIPVIFDVSFISIIDATTLPAIRDKSLMIRDISVVEDVTRTYDPCRTPKGNANGVWSFGHLITNMANGFSTPQQFLVDWVDTKLFSAQTLASSGDATTNRNVSKAKLIRAWIRNSGLPVPAGSGIPAGWQTLALKAHEFPVRLLAIVNRLDLRGNSGYGGFSNAGEGRFVFCFVDSNASCSNGNNGPGTMTFIFEYGIPLRNCASIKDYAQKWWDLRSEPFGNGFNAKLEVITKVFTAANANPSKPNKSALNHLRTNDFLPRPNISTHPWDIRDFEIDATTNKLKMIHPAKEPMEAANAFSAPINNTKIASLAAFVNGLPMTPSNPSPPYEIPDTEKAMHAPMNVSPAVRYIWRSNTANPVDPFKRREFSLNTCSNCHKGETNTIFTHIKPRAINLPSALSGFMTGLGSDDNSSDNDSNVLGAFFVNDTGPTPLPDRKEFNEALRRAKDLEKLIFGSPCFQRPNFPHHLIAVNEILRHRPLNMTH